MKDVAAVFLSKAFAYIFVAAVILVIFLTGCAPEPPAETVKPAIVKVTATDFCQIMRGLAPPSGKPTWSARDTSETIHGIRRVAAAVDKRCVPPRKPTPTT